MENRINRVHSDHKHAGNPGYHHIISDQQISAQAFTFGSDIFFSRHANPQDSRLLSHELMHVVQQQHMEGQDC